MTAIRKALIVDAVAKNSARFGFALPLEMFAGLETTEWDETNALAHIHESFETEAVRRVREEE